MWIKSAISQGHADAIKNLNRLQTEKLAILQDYVDAGKYCIGSTGPAGGLIFYDKGYSSGGWRYLEVANPEDGWITYITSKGSTTKWSTYMPWCDNSVPETRTRAVGITIGCGQSNTDLIVASQGAEKKYAASLCDNLSLGGFSDWFLPSLDELKEFSHFVTIVLELSAIKQKDRKEMINTIFFKSIKEKKFWSSSEENSMSAWAYGNLLNRFSLDFGPQHDYPKGSLYHIVAVRAF